MAVFTKSAQEVYAPTDANGNVRGANMGEAQVLHTEVERAVQGAEAGRVDQVTWAELAAITGTRAGQPAQVLGPDAGTHTDPVVAGTVANTGTYVWSASPAGWRRVGGLPSTLVHATNSGAGTANAVQATTAVAYWTDAYDALITVNFTAENTGAMTLSLDGEAPRDLVTNTGAAIPSGYITAGMSALLQIDANGDYRLFSYGDGAAVQAAAEAAQAAAEAAQTAAETAAAALPLTFSSVALAAAATIDGAVKVVDTNYYAPNYAAPATLTGGARYRREASEPAHDLKFQSADGAWWGLDTVRELDLTVCGAIPDSDSYAAGNSAALDRALSYWEARSDTNICIVSGAGRWWFSGEHDLESSESWEKIKLKGLGRDITKWETTLEGADKVFINGGDSRNGRLTLEGITFVTRNGAGTACPILVKDINVNESDWIDCSFVQGSTSLGGTLTLTSGIWNSSVINCHSSGGGHFKPANQNIASTTRFTLTSGDETVTCNESIFTAADVGRRYIFGEAGGEWVGTVASLNGAAPTNSVEMTEQAPYSEASEYGWSDGVRATTTASNGTVTVEGGAVSTDVGRYVVIRSAGTINGITCHHRATVTEVTNSTTIVVSPAPTQSVSGAMIYWSPAHMDIKSPTDPETQRTNDFYWEDFRVERYNGLGVYIEDAVDFTAVNFKGHGTDPSSLGYDPTHCSQAAMLIKSKATTIFGANHEAFGFDDARFICSGSEHFHIKDTVGRVDNNQAIVYSEHPFGAYSTISLGDSTIYNQQWDMTASGMTTRRYLAGPVDVRQTLNHYGETTVISKLNKRLRSGPGGALSRSISMLGSDWLYIGTGTEDKIGLGDSSYRNGNARCGMIAVMCEAGHGALVHYTVFTGGSSIVTLLAGNTANVAVSNTAGATTAGKITFSADNDYFYIDNDKVSTRFNFASFG